MDMNSKILAKVDTTVITEATISPTGVISPTAIVHTAAKKDRQVPLAIPDSVLDNLIISL